MDTIAELLLQRLGDARAGVATGGRRWSWDETVRESGARADVIRQLRPAERERPFHVGVLLENVPEFLFWLGGAALSGATMAGINPTHSDADLAAEIRHVDLDLIITDAEGRARLATLDTGVSADRIVDVDGSEYLEQMVGALPQEVHADPQVSASTRMLLLYTSGSTGASKAAICSQGRLAALGRMNRDRFPLCREDVCYCSMPLFHGNALMALWAPALVAGSTIVLARRFSASGFLPDIRQFGVTFFTYVGRVIGYLLAQPETPDDTDNPLTHGFGTEASPEDIDAFAQRFGCRLIEGYGSSEAGGLTKLGADTPPTALGQPARASVQVVSADSRQVCPPARFDEHGRLDNAEEAVGEIVDTEGAARFEGYYNNPEADAERVRHGWYWTGDLGFTDGRGFLYFAGRSGDWIRVDSENISALLVERVLRRHPYIILAGAFAIPDARSGDQVMAAVETRPGVQFEDLQLEAFLTRQPNLGNKGRPRFLRLSHALPTTGSGKLCRKQMAVEAWRTSEPVYCWLGRGTPQYEVMDEAVKDDLSRQFIRNGRARYLPQPDTTLQVRTRAPSTA